MPIVKGPLFSAKAFGSIKKLLTFQGLRNKTVCKGFQKNPNSYSADQLGIRSVYRRGADSWNLLSPAEKENYNLLSKEKIMTGFNYFMGLYLVANIPLISYGKYGISKYGKRDYY